MFLLAALIAVASAPPAGQSTIPFNYVDNRIVVECNIDGQGPFAMILDTGSPSIALTPETAAKLAAVENPPDIDVNELREAAAARIDGAEADCASRLNPAIDKPPAANWGPCRA